MQHRPDRPRTRPSRTTKPIPTYEPQFLVNLRILLARNVRCAYKCVVLPDCKRRPLAGSIPVVSMHLIGAWCSLTSLRRWLPPRRTESQCTYRCVVLPDAFGLSILSIYAMCLNAPTGAWCSLTT